jgi:hypothetical protein
VVPEVLGFRAQVDMLVETVANPGNANSHQDPERKNDRRFNHLHDDQVLLSLL